MSIRHKKAMKLPPFSNFEEKRAKLENEAQNWVAELAALAAARPLFSVDPCGKCNRPVQHEAGYRCSLCKQLFHVRCLAHIPCQCPFQALTIALQVCTACHSVSSGPEIDDVMGVCRPKEQEPYQAHQRCFSTQVDPFHDEGAH